MAMCERMSFYAPTNVSWQTAEGMKSNTAMKKNNPEKSWFCAKQTTGAVVQDYFPAIEAPLALWMDVYSQ